MRNSKYGIMVLIAALLLAVCVNAQPAAADFDQVVLLDVQSLRGGVNLWISGDGNAVCCFVKPPQKNETGLQEIRYSFKLSGQQAAALSDLLNRHDFFHIRTADRYGVPDEARPVLFVKSGGRTHTAAKWAGDRHRHFDPIYEFLLKIARSGRAGAEAGKGAFDGNWKPEGFPENRAITYMTRPNPDGK